MYYPYSENNDADQLRSYYVFVFAYAKGRFSHNEAFIKAECYEDGVKVSIILAGTRDWKGAAKTAIEMLRSLSFPGCFLFSILVSRYGLVAISQIIPNNQIRLTHAKSTQSQLAEKTNFDELSSIRFQDSVVGKVSNVKIPLAQRSEELNVHLDVPAKYLKNKNISAERLVNRERRNIYDRAVFDEDEIETLTDIALQQCPYNTFCHRNRTHAPEFRSGFGSCCKDCFCDEQCGERNDCCWKFLDNRKIEKNE